MHVTSAQVRLVAPSYEGEGSHALGPRAPRGGVGCCIGRFAVKVSKGYAMRH
jgi:hypothetical protein